LFQEEEDTSSPILQHFVNNNNKHKKENNISDEVFGDTAEAKLATYITGKY